MTDPMWWSHDGDTVQWHETEDEAIARCRAAHDYARALRDDGEGWPEWVWSIAWGRQHGRAVGVEQADGTYAYHLRRTP